MYEKIAAAFDRQDYRAAAALLKPLLQKSPRDPWLQFYAARLYEVTGKIEPAMKGYRQLLRETIIPKLALQARQGIERIETQEKERRKQALADATSDPANAELGFLILEPVTGQERLEAAKKFAKVMQVDPQVARVQMPGRSWQLYRSGMIGELRVYGQELQQVGVPAIWTSQAEIEQIQVFRVDYIRSISPDPTVICRSEADQLGSLTFSWSEVTQRVQGRLPVFEKVVDLGPWGKLERKNRTQDYVQICDLHLPGRNCILRFCDASYQFQDSAVAGDSPEHSLLQSTTRINWNMLLTFLVEHIPNAKLWSDFEAFAETALDHRVPLSRLNAQIDIERKAETYWDPAFQLYSTLAYLKHIQKKNR